MRGQKAPALVLKEAHEAAATKAGADKKMPRYAVNFRLDKIARSAKGGYADRYDKLNTLIKVFGVKPWHYATSSWEISSASAGVDLEGASVGSARRQDRRPGGHAHRPVSGVRRSEEA